MISDEFEMFGDNHFWHGQTKTKILVQKIIHFIRIQNIPSKQIFIFQKSRIFIQKKLFIFLKSRIFIPKNIHFFKRGCIGQGYQDVICCGDDVGHESYLIFNSIKYKWVGGRQHCERQGQHGGDEDQGGLWYYQYVSLQLNFLLSYDKLWLWWLKSKLLSSIF